MSADPKPLLTAREVARLLRLHEKTVRRMIREGRLPCLRIGRSVRFVVDDIDRWLMRHKEP